MVQDLLHILNAMLHFRLLLVQQRRHLCRGVGAHRLRPRKHQARGFHDFMFGIRRQLIPHNVAGGGVSRDHRRQKKNIERQ